MSKRNSSASLILSIDVEDWYHLNYSSMDTYQNKSFESRVRQNTETLLAALAKYNTRATFFFLGSVAEQYPALVRAAQEQGHEIASHGFAHQLVHHQTRTEFARDVEKSLDVLQEIVSVPVRGYRAPSWSVSEKTPWFYDVLSELGFAYSSSVFPYKTYLYGDSQSPLTPFIKDATPRKIYEIPATVLQIGNLRFPFSGGFYFRFFPFPVLRLAAGLTHRSKRAVMVYLHPREIDPAQPRLPLPFVDRFVNYCNLNTTLAKLERFLSNFRTITVSEYLKREQANGAKPYAE